MKIQVWLPVTFARRSCVAYLLQFRVCLPLAIWNIIVSPVLVEAALKVEEKTAMEISI
jgi:hypothetical protein